MSAAAASIALFRDVFAVKLPHIASMLLQARLLLAMSCCCLCAQSDHNHALVNPYGLIPIGRLGLLPRLAGVTGNAEITLVDYTAKADGLDGVALLPSCLHAISFTALRVAHEVGPSLFDSSLLDRSWTILAHPRHAVCATQSWAWCTLLLEPGIGPTSQAV